MNCSYKRWLWLAVLLLAGCQTTTDRQSRADHEAIGRRAEQADRQLRQTANAPAVIMQDEVPQFTRRSIALNRAHMLPPQIGLVTLSLPGKYNLRTVATHIERLTKIPVILAPDALLPASEFASSMVATKLPRGNESASGGRRSADPSAQTTRQVALGVERAGGTRQWEATQQAEDLIELNHRGTLAGLLDRVASQAQLQWMYANGQIRFYRLVTQSIAVKTLPGTLSQSGTLTLSSGMGSMAVSTNTDSNIWTAIEKTATELLSAMGKINVNPALGVVTVTDALPNVQSIERYVESINRQLLRQVSLNVEVLQVNLNSANQAGIDWNFVTSSAQLGTVTLGSAPSVVKGASAGVISLVRPGSSGNDNGVFVRALERFGRVSTSYSSVITTMNRQAVPMGSVSTRSYLKQVTPMLSTNATGATTYGAPSLTPGEISTGFTMSILPVVLDSNQIMLQCTINISSLKDLTIFSTGTGQAQQSVQQPNVTSFATQQRMAVRSGDTIVLSGFENESTETQESDTVRNSLPGSRSNTRDKSTLVVLITPRLLDF